MALAKDNKTQDFIKWTLWSTLRILVGAILGYIVGVIIHGSFGFDLSEHGLGQQFLWYLIFVEELHLVPLPVSL